MEVFIFPCKKKILHKRDFTWCNRKPLPITGKIFISCFNKTLEKQGHGYYNFLSLFSKPVIFMGQALWYSYSPLTLWKPYFYSNTVTKYIPIEAL